VSRHRARVGGRRRGKRPVIDRRRAPCSMVEAVRRDLKRAGQNDSAPFHGQSVRRQKTRSCEALTGSAPGGGSRSSSAVGFVKERRVSSSPVKFCQASSSLCLTAHSAISTTCPNLP
jgi:hypothetical protein